MPTRQGQRASRRLHREVQARVRKTFGHDKAGVGPQWVGWQAQLPSCSKKRWASSAAMQPVPALVMAWR